MTLGRPIGSSNGRGESLSSRVGCCRDQHPRDQKLISLSPATAAADSPCQDPAGLGQEPCQQAPDHGPGPFCSSKRTGQLGRLLTARATAKATLSSRSIQRSVPHASKPLENALGPGGEQTGDLLTYLLTCPSANR